MPDLRPVLFIVGGLLTILAGAMLIPAALDLLRGDDDWQAFLAAAAVTLFFGGSLLLASRGEGWRVVGPREGFLVVNLAWIASALFGALPFLFASPGLELTDALFESMSGITTTGASVIEGLERQPPGILIWRALLNWLGGLGFIVTALLILPGLGIGGMALFRVESLAGRRRLPRAAQTAASLAALYAGFTLLGFIALRLLGMGSLEAAAHALAAISTGGFGTRDASIAPFGSLGIELVLILLMILGAMPFLVLLRAMTGQPGLLLRDGQVRWLLGLLAAATLAIAVWLATRHGYEGGQALRSGLFTTVSIMTGTGLLIENPTAWGGFPTTLLLLLMFIGGAAGSAGCGVKIFRVQIFASLALAQLRRLTQPHGVFIPTFNGRPVPDEISDQVMGFFFLYGLTYIVLATGLGLMGLDLTTALSAAASALANVGPGLGDPLIAAGNFAGLPDAAKWWLTAGMLLGRLELLTLFVVLTRRFWRG